MKYLSFDRRVLAAMRTGVALVLMLDLLIRLSDLEVFYSDTGVMPLEMLFKCLLCLRPYHQRFMAGIAALVSPFFFLSSHTADWIPHTIIYTTLLVHAALTS